MAQSNRCSGLETIRDDTTSSTVSGPRLPITEAGLRVAWYRCRTATSARSSLVTPNSCMYRCAHIAYHGVMYRPVRGLAAGPHRHHAVYVIRGQPGVGQRALDRLERQRRAGPLQGPGLLGGVRADDRRLPLRKGHRKNSYYSILLSITIYLTERQCTREGPA